MFMTEETMDDIAQWMHDTSWETPEAIDSEVIHESDIDNCIHDGAKVTKYEDGKGPIISVWECGLCGRIGEVGKES